MYRRGKNWTMTAIVDGHQVCRSTGTPNKRLAQKKEDVWRAQIAEGYSNLLKKSPPLNEWAEKYLESVDHENTRRRYECSKVALVSFFGALRLDRISATHIERFKISRRNDGIRGATLNRDLRFLAQVLKQAERERYLVRSPFDLAKFFVNESLFERCATGGTQQIECRDQGCPNFSSMQSRTVAVAESDRTGILRMGIPQLRKPQASFAKRWPEGLGERIEEGRATIFPNLLSASHVCLAVDERRCVAAHDCPDAGAFIDTDRSPICASSGSEPT